MPGLLRPGPKLSRGPRLAPAPGRSRALLAPLAILLLLAGWLVWPHQHPDPRLVVSGDRSPRPAPTTPPAARPTPSLQQRSLPPGTRKIKCLRMVVGLDVSGSMRDFAAARDEALRQLLSWAPRNLLAADEIAVVDFAANAGVRMPPTGATSPGPITVPAVMDGTYTYIAPLLDEIAKFPAKRKGCTVGLILLSDAQLADLPTTEADGRALLRRYGIDRVVLLVPGLTIGVPAVWSAGFPQAPPQRFDGTEPDATALAIAQAVATLTGQKLT